MNPNPPRDGAQRITDERRRHVAIEGWTPAHDAEHKQGQLAKAGALYALLAVLLVRHPKLREVDQPASLDWPWERHWWKPCKDPVRNLEKAGALMAAEIDRLLDEASEAVGPSPAPPSPIPYMEPIQFYVNNMTAEAKPGIKGISYEEVVSLAFRGNAYLPPAGTLLAITYGQPGENGGGMLTAGQRVALRAGMVFNVTDTANA